MYHKIRKNIEANKEFCYRYPLNPKKSNGSIKPFYALKVFSEFDKHYKLKESKK
jgi:hypothetical protein